MDRKYGAIRKTPEDATTTLFRCDVATGNRSVEMTRIDAEVIDERIKTYPIFESRANIEERRENYTGIRGLRK